MLDQQSAELSAELSELGRVDERALESFSSKLTAFHNGGLVAQIKEMRAQEDKKVQSGTETKVQAQDREFFEQLKANDFVFPAHTRDTKQGISPGAKALIGSRYGMNLSALG